MENEKLDSFIVQCLSDYCKADSHTKQNGLATFIAKRVVKECAKANDDAKRVEQELGDEYLKWFVLEKSRSPLEKLTWWRRRAEVAELARREAEAAQHENKLCELHWTALASRAMADKEKLQRQVAKFKDAIRARRGQ